MEGDQTPDYGESSVIQAADRFGSKGFPGGSPLQGGSGGGTFDGMEARVATLETHAEYIKRDVGEIRNDVGALRAAAADMRVDVATLKERVAHLPSKAFIISAVLGGTALLGAFVTFQQKIQALLGVGH